MSWRSLKNDAQLLVGQVKDAASQGTLVLAVAIICGALAVTFGLILLATAGRA